MADAILLLFVTSRFVFLYGVVKWVFVFLTGPVCGSSLRVTR